MSRPPIFVWQDSATHAARVARDPVFAAEHVRKEALTGEPGAQLSWALMLLDGHGTPRDVVAAFHWFQLAARSGNRDAINMMGRCHELGWGTHINLTLAAQCYRSAGESGHAWAQFNLACLILREDGVPGELTEALALLVRAARQGNAKAMNMLGRSCEEGWRGRAKPAAARRWYLRAARGGCFRGAFHTARHFIAVGDIDQGVVWLRRSIAAAPADFCTETGTIFAAHPDTRLRTISDFALAQAVRAPQHPPAEDTTPAFAIDNSAPSPGQLRRRRVMGRTVRRVAASFGMLRQ